MVRRPVTVGRRGDALRGHLSHSRSVRAEWKSTLSAGVPLVAAAAGVRPVAAVEDLDAEEGPVALETVDALPPRLPPGIQCAAPMPLIESPEEPEDWVPALDARLPVLSLLATRIITPTLARTDS